MRECRYIQFTSGGDRRGVDNDSTILSRISNKFDNITFTNIKDKTCVPCDVIVDDCPEYIDPEPESVLKICINHSYNMECNAIHFDSLYSFAKLICDFDLHIINRNNFIIYTKKE